MIPKLQQLPIEVWEWISNFIPYFNEYLITYPCWDLSKSTLITGATGYISVSREEESLIDMFLFEILVAYVESLALAHNDDPSLGKFVR